MGDLSSSKIQFILDKACNGCRFSCFFIRHFWLKRSAKRLASIVLPVPGGQKSRLCCPAAAMVKARLACCCPIISVKSPLQAVYFSSLFCGISCAIGSVSRRLRKLTTCNSEWAKCVLAFETSEASFAFCLVKIIWRFAFSAEITARLPLHASQRACQS